MSSGNTVQHPASVDAYIRHGWSLVPIPFGSKGPQHKGWNAREMCLRSSGDLPMGWGIGLAHAYSGTMALDIDYWDRAAFELMMQGIDLNALYAAPDAVIIDSGRTGRGKLIYAMPFGLTLPSKKLEDIDAQGKRYNYLDFRCGTSNGLTVQDVLPPTIHPETRQPYRWAGSGNWTRLPMIPDALLRFWSSIVAVEEAPSYIGDTAQGVAEWPEIERALWCISPDCSRDEWIKIGMSLHKAGADTDRLDHAFDLWKRWSSKSKTKYPGEREIKTQWRSFTESKGNIVTLGTLFHMAAQSGWVRTAIDVAGIFDAVNVQYPQILDPLMRPVAPDIDITLFPPIIQRRAKELSESIGCDPLVPLWSGMAAVCGAADAQTRLELMPGFKVPPVLWVCTIGSPADKKTPGSSPMFEPLTRIEQEDRPNFARRMLEWEGLEAVHVAAKKDFVKYATSVDALLANTKAPDVPPLPEPPRALKIMVSDITSQKLVRQCSTRPRGLLCYMDEMNGWVNKVCDPRSGEDRSSWVVAYESRWYEMDRVGAGTYYVDNYAVSIYGNMQPKVLEKNMALLTSDGLFQRFIPIPLRSDRARLGHPIPDALTNAVEYEQMIRTIYSLPPLTYRLSDAAFHEFRRFQEWYETQKRDEIIVQSMSEFLTAFGKLEGLTGRLCLVMHLMTDPLNIEVSKDTLDRTIALVREYVIPAMRHVLNGGACNAFDQWLSEHLIHHCSVVTMTLADIRKAAKKHLEADNIWQANHKVLNSMAGMEVSGWVRRVDDGSREHQGVAEWAINPQLAVQFRDHRRLVIEAKRRQLGKQFRNRVEELVPDYGLLTGAK